MNQILLIDASFQPLQTVSRKKALKLNFLNKASFLIPEVLQLLNYIHRKNFRLRFTKRSIYLRDRYTCQYCGKAMKLSEITIDHVIPLSRGGHNSFLNCVSCCQKCNVKKADRLPHEAGMFLIKKPWVPTNINLLEVHVRPLLEKFNSYLSQIIN